MAHDIELRSSTGFSIRLTSGEDLGGGGTISAFNAKLISLISYINGISKTSLSKHNTSLFPTSVPDSISINPTFINFTVSEQTNNTVVVTSSSGWSAAINSDIDGMIQSFTSAGDDQGTISVTVNQNTSDFSRAAVIRLTCGSATTDLSLCQDGNVETCG